MDRLLVGATSHEECIDRLINHYLFLLIVFQNGVVHRDLKLENVLLDENCNIKVIWPPDLCCVTLPWMTFPQGINNHVAPGGKIHT